MSLSPAPAMLAEALQKIEVTQSDTAPGVCQFTFHADRTAGVAPDYALITANLLQPGKRIAATVTLNGTSQVLFDGFISNQELSHTTSFGASTLTVTAQDVSLLMDLHEISDQYPGMGDAVIVAAVLARYMLFGVLPEIVPPLASFLSDPLYQVPQQNATDRAYLRQLAAQYAYVFYIRPGPALGTNTAYWGPPPRLLPPQPALTVNVGPASNVQSISFTHDALSAQLVHGWVQDAELDEVLPVATLSGLRLPVLAAKPAPLSDFPLTRSAQFTDTRPTIAEALIEAQALTDASTDDVLVGQGSLDVLRYGSILTAPGVVGVRGVGLSYDGLYYVQSVTHSISRSAYQQKFTVKREGQMTTVGTVRP